MNMAACNYCGSNIIFGGARDGNLRFCNARCQQAGAFLAISNKIPETQVQESVWKLHQGACPKCGGSGPVDVHQGFRVWSALFLTRWSNSQQLSCRSCGAKKQMADAAFSLVLGWWGFPWGMILTPIQVGRNLMSVARPPEASKPSPQLEKALRIAMAKQLLSAAKPKA
jgi:hypothetical protein